MKYLQKIVTLLLLAGLVTSEASARRPRRRHHPRRHHSYRHPYRRRYPHRWWNAAGPFWWNATRPAYYRNTADPYARDNAGKTYWRVYNKTAQPLTLSTDREKSIILAPGEERILYRTHDFGMIIQSDDQKKILQTKDHTIVITPETLQRFANLSDVRATFEKEKS